MTEQPLVHLRYRRVELVQQVDTGGRDARGDEPAVGAAPLALDEAGVLEAIQQPRDVRHLRDQPVAYLIPAEAVGPGTAQDAKHVVLRGRNAERLERFAERMAEHGRRALDVELGLLLEAAKRFALLDL